MAVSPASEALVRTGVEGLDDILMGGLPPRRIYLVQGEPGVGKTTLALQFLMEGARNGEPCLYVTLSETREELVAIARSHGWSLAGIEVFELSGGNTAQPQDEENTLYVPAEVELGERMRELLAEVDRVHPRRVVIDSCSELRLLAQSPLRFRRQVLGIKQELVDRGCTIVLIDNPVFGGGGDPLLQSVVHGVVILEQLTPLFGAERRRLRIQKLREVAYRGGFHDMKIEKGGLIVFPRLVAHEHHDDFPREPVSSGVTALDHLLGGGLGRGTSTLIMGPAGTGKSALATQYIVAAARRGEHGVIFVFDEGRATLLGRAAATGMDLSEHERENRVMIQQVDPAELSPGEFAGIVRRAVEKSNARTVVIDSLNGYLNAMPQEQFLTIQLHELLSYLAQRGVVTIMVVAQHGFLGEIAAPIDVSYLSDCVIMMRYFEADGRVRKAISVVKKRSGPHEDAIREFALGETGAEVGPPLEGFQGVLTGVPVLAYDGSRRKDAT